jgi:hypothetical protein
VQVDATADYIKRVVENTIASESIKDDQLRDAYTARFEAVIGSQE